MHIWSQRLREGRHIYNRRGHIWFRENGASVGWQLCVPSQHVGVEVRLDWDDEPLHFFVGLFGLFAFWLSIDAAWARRLRDRVTDKRSDGRPTYEGRELSVRWHDAALWWNLGCASDGWSKEDGWRNSCFHPVDWLLGSQKHSERDVAQPQPVTIPMPEGSYKGTVRIFESTWKRPRWPVPKRMIRADIQVPQPPRFAGKGENSWDQGDDGIFAMTCPETTVDAAIERYRAAVLRNRERYGEPSAQPA